MDTRLLHDLAISETGFVFDPHTGSTFNVNPTGLAILTALRGGKSPDEIVEALREQFEAIPPDAPDHVMEFIGMLQRYALLPEEQT